MTNLFWKPYSLFLFTVLVFGVVLSLSAENWLAIWMGLEINLYCFIPMVLMSSKSQEKEAAVKYFISQSVPSALMVVSFISYSGEALNVSSFLFFALLMKMGLAPVHYWLPSVMGAVSWGLCWMLATIQKVAPMMIIFYANSFSPLILVYSAGLSSIVGGVGGLNQTMLRVILAYSSIGHMGWILAGSMVDSSSAFFYFFSYIVIISGLFFFFDYMKISSGNYLLKLGGSFWLSFFFLFLLLSLGGLPPLLGFYPKMLVLSGLVGAKFIVLSFFLVLGSVLNLFYYLKLVFIGLLMSPVSLYSMGGRAQGVGVVVMSGVFSLGVFGVIIFFSLFCV